jgi:hypothetical protein
LAILLREVNARMPLGQQADSVKNMRRPRVEVVVPLITCLVPTMLRHPAAIRSSVKNFPLVREQEIRLHRRLEFFHALDGMPETAPGIHRPESTGFFMLHEDGGEVRRAPPVGEVADQRSIKIRAQKPKVRHRLSLNTPQPPAAIFLCAECEICYNGLMKSAYELAMSRLEKSSPAVQLTLDQKQQIAEVDSSINAKIAEKKIFLEDQIAKAPYQERDALERQLVSEIARLEEKRERDKEKIRTPEAA